jgi:flagellar hook protein FlgE
MSLMSSLYTGASGLAANSIDLSVIGDNISNANTIGFKGSRAAFEDALSQSVLNNGQLGTGTQLEAVQRLLAQGSLANTGIATDLALDGTGFFVVKGNHGGVDANFYTRAGQFTVDKAGYMVNLQGLRVQGFPADALGNIQPGPADLLVGNATSAPQPTSNITVKGNLDADATTPALPWDVANAAATSNYSTATTVYDSLGNAHAVTIYYRKTGAGTWDWHAVTDGGGIQGGTAGTPTEIGNGTLAYDAKGALTAVTQTSTFSPAGATDPQALTFNFGTASPGGTGIDGMTQFGGKSETSFTSQDGWGAGALSSVAVDDKGEITGTFSNGQTRLLGDVAVAGFTAPDQLRTVGGNLFVETAESGQVTVGKAGDAGRGNIVAGALEQSNVDMAGEFVRMIAAQRGFQANSKTISTADQLLQELMNLKR